MNPIWVDTDFGFDDLWALLLLRHMACPVAGVSLVAGNVPLAQVAANALGAVRAYGFTWPLWQGADKPLVRPAETAVRILGPTGMRSRGARLPAPQSAPPPGGAVEALRDWLTEGSAHPRTVLALGPLTNIAALVQRWPEAAARIERLVWMGGSAGPGNHTPEAEFNAVADPEAAAAVAAAGCAIDVVDLTFCRRVTFDESDIPEADRLTRDLLGGYLDIALERGRPAMAIYDPIAAVAASSPDALRFSPRLLEVETKPGPLYGKTRFEPGPAAHVRIATGSDAALAPLCLGALAREAVHGPRH